jgi:hypothetical protein
VHEPVAAVLGGGEEHLTGAGTGRGGHVGHPVKVWCSVPLELANLTVTVC